MLTQNLKVLKTQTWFKKLAFSVGIAGVSLLVSVPVLAQFYLPAALFQPSAYRNYPYRNSEKSIADTLVEDSKYSNLVYELKQAGLFDKLKDGSFTIFAPTDEAFNTLPKDLYKRYKQERLKVLNYHLVTGEVTQQDIENKGVKTIAGSTVKIATDSKGGVQIDNANIKPPSIQAKNGVIVEVNRVLLPPEFQQ